MSVSTPLLYGGIRNTLIDLRALQAELVRSSAQTQENRQVGNAFSGALVTNTLDQAVREEQEGSEVVTQSITIDPPSPPVSGVPQKFLDHYNYVDRVTTAANIFDILTKGEGINAQVQRVDQGAYAHGSDAVGGNSKVDNSLIQTANNLQTLTQAALETNFSAVTGTLPILVAKEREILVTADRSNTSGIASTAQIQGVAPVAVQSPGTKEVLKTTDPFLTSAGAANAGTELNDLAGGSGTYQPGVDTIRISGTAKDGSAVTPMTFHYGNPSAGVQEVVRTASPLATPSGNAAATTPLNDLSLNTTDYQPGEEIVITGQDFDGAVVSATFTVGDPGGTSQVLTSGAIASNDSVSQTTTASTKLRYLGGDGTAGYVAYESGAAGTSTISITGKDFNGNNVNQSYSIFDKDVATLGNLIDFLNGGATVPTGDTTNDYTIDKIPGATVSLDGSGQLVLTADSGASSNQLALTISDGQLTGSASGYSWPSFSQTTAGLDGNRNGTTLGDLVNFVNGNGVGTWGASDKFPHSTLSLSNGTLSLTADSVGQTNLAFALADQGTAKTSWPTFSETTAGADVVAAGDGTTLGDLVGKIGSVFLDAAATIDGDGRIVLTADDIGEAQYSLSLRDDAGSANRAFASNAFVKTTPGTERVEGSILSDTSTQTARSNMAHANNYLTQTATHVMTNNVVNTHTVDVRRIDSPTTPTPTAPLTPRSIDIIVRMNETAGDVSRVSNIGAAVQSQALVQISEGGVDQDGNPTDGGGTSKNIATQSASDSEQTTVSETVQIQA